MHTGIPFNAWAEVDYRVLTTAINIVEEQQKAASRGTSSTAHREPGAGGPQYSG